MKIAAININSYCAMNTYSQSIKNTPSCNETISEIDLNGLSRLSSAEKITEKVLSDEAVLLYNEYAVFSSFQMSNNPLKTAEISELLDAMKSEPFS